MPLIADGAVDSQSLLKGKIDNSYQHDMKADDDQSTDGEVSDEAPFDTIEDLAAV